MNARVDPIDPHTPCIIGVAQQTWHPGELAAPEPLMMQAEMARAAAEDAQARGGGAGVLAAVDSLSVVNCLSWRYDDPVARLSDALGVAPRHRAYSTMSGTSPQSFVNAGARQMRDGELDVVLVVGGEALHTKRAMKKARQRPYWSHRSPDAPSLDPSLSFLPSELTHEVFQAWLTFAVRDVARRAARGETPDAYRHSIGELMAPMTRIAAANPHAWFRREHTAEELVTVSADNRIVGYPYTKHTVAIMDVDMAAAVVLATHAAADRLGVPVERRVYLRSFAEGADGDHLAEHPDLSCSPAMRRVFGATLTGAGVDHVDQVAHFDLYSCFAASLNFALDALGLDARGLAESKRSVTVTGGLPFAGGPGSNYTSHALATMVGRLRADPGSLGLVSGVGMHMAKHTAAIYSTTPGTLVEGPAAVEPEVLAVRDAHDGTARIAAYSVVHSRDGEPAWALLVADVDDASRCYARTDDPEIMADLETQEMVGATVTLRSVEGVNRVSSIRSN